MKLQVFVTIKGLNVEHRTSNIEHRMMMTLCFVDFKLNKSGLQLDANRWVLSFEPESDSESKFIREMHFARSRFNR